MFVELMIGVTGGIISSIIMFIIFSYIEKIIIPYYKERNYRGIDVSGSWVVNSEEYDRRSIVIDINQKADNLTAKSTHILTEEYKKNNNFVDTVRVYELTGYINDRFVTLIGKPDDGKKLGAVSFLFEVIGDGKTLKGIGMAYSSTELAIGSRHFTAKRK